MTTETEWFVVMVSAIMGVIYLFRGIRAKQTGDVTAALRERRRKLEGREATEMMLQWLGGGIILTANALLAIFFPLIGFIIWLIVAFYLISYESSALVK